MKSIVTIIAIVFLSFNTTNAQDLIITTKGDSIPCKIIKVTTGGVLFLSKHQGEIKRVKIPASDVRIYEKDFYAGKNVAAAAMNSKYDKFTISPYGGLSYLIAKTSSQVPGDLKQYMKELKSGYHFGADLAFFVSRKTGVGLKYVNFKTSNQAHVTGTNQSGQMQSGMLRDNITTQYIAPVLTSRRFSVNQKTIFNTGLSLGYLGYKNDATVIDNFKLSGSTVGVGFDIGLENKLSKTLGLEIKLGMIGGSLGKFEKSNGSSVQTITLESEQRENISRIDISVALKWHY